MKKNAFILLNITGGSVIAALALFKSLSLLSAAILLCSFAAVAVAAWFDYKTMLIPNAVPLSLFIARAVLFTGEYLAGKELPSELAGNLLAALATGAILLATSKFSKGGIGMGDVKLLMAVGFACGFETVFSVLLAALLVCAVVGGIMVIRKKRTSKDALPFAPFVLCGFVITLVSGVMF